jgi:glycine/D-amino acid oxidase-like deaminating enzyme
MRLQSIDETSDLLIIGGEDQETSKAKSGDESLERLEQWVYDHFPMVEAIDYTWSGEINNSHDSLAFIGRNPGDTNTFVVTGDSGNGITYATIAGMLIRDLILGRSNPWISIFDPSRLTP